MRELLARVCPPAAVRAAWNGERDPGRWRALEEAGVAGMLGAGLTEVEMCIALEEAGRAALPEPLLETGLIGVPRGDTFPLGGRMFQLIVLITAREIDQQYEWSAHEPAGLRAGLEQTVIDVVKYDRDVTGLVARDALVIRYFRALLREHKVSSELWASMVKEFGRQRTIDMMMLMADYFTVGTMMNAVDQHLPPDRKEALLPV